MKRKGFNLVTQWTYNDGGRIKCGFAKEKRDCVARAIAIATKKSYRKVFRDLHKLNGSKHGAISTYIHRHYLQKLGYAYEYLPGNSTFNNTYLPKNCIVMTTRHLACIKNHIVNDTWDSTKTKSGKRTGNILGYYIKLPKQIIKQ